MKKQLSKRIEKGIRIGILSVAFILAFSISIAGINYIYFRWNCKKLDAVNAVACKYEKKNAILNSFMFLGYFPDPDHYVNCYTHVYNSGYMPVEVMDEYVLQYYLNRYEYLEGKKVSLSSVETYYSHGEDDSERHGLEELDADTKVFIEYMTDPTINFVKIYRIESTEGSIWCEGGYFVLLDAKCQEMYGVGLFDVAVEGEGDSSKIGNFDLWDYVLTMDQMNAAAQSLLLEKDSVS